MVGPRGNWLEVLGTSLSRKFSQPDVATDRQTNTLPNIPHHNDILWEFGAAFLEIGIEFRSNCPNYSTKMNVRPVRVCNVVHRSVYRAHLFKSFRWTTLWVCRPATYKTCRRIIPWNIVCCLNYKSSGFNLRVCARFIPCYDVAFSFLRGWR